MSITKEEMLSYIYDPALIQKKQLDQLSKMSNGDFMLVDPTSPFMMCLEAANSTASAAIYETNNIIRKKYPSLASSKDDLYHHLFDEQLSNIFAMPAEIEMFLYINIEDLINVRYRPGNANYYETTIPKYTKITVVDYPFMLLNDIVVKLYDNGSVFAEQQLNSSNNIAFTDIGTLQTVLINSSDGTPWIAIRTKVKQLNRIVSSKTIVPSDGFQHMVTIENKYVYSQVSYRNNTTHKQLNLMYNDEYIDPLTPTCFISPYNTEILYRIPDVYLMDAGVSGVCTIETYETIGKIYLPLTKYKVADFSIELGDIGATPSTATMKQISILAEAPTTAEGGVNSNTMLDLRNIVINNITNINLPITHNQLNRLGLVMGYKILQIEDVVTSRLFLALKSLPDFESDVIFAKPDVFFNTAKIILEEVQNNSNVIITKTNFIIKANTIFKYENGIVKITTQEEINNLNMLSIVNLIEHLETHKYFYTPYTYIIENNETYSTSRVYALETPDINSIKILNKNQTVAPGSNINMYMIQKIDKGYEIRLTLAPNKEFLELDPNSIKLQLKVPLVTNGTYVHFDSTFDSQLGHFVFEIHTDGVLDEKDALTITNGYSELYTKKVNLNFDAYVFTTSNDESATDNSGFLLNEIYNPNNDKCTVFTKEQLTITIGNRLKYIYNKLYNIYNEKKYLKYEMDIPLIYNENVYEIDPDTGCPYVCNEDETDHNIDFQILHEKGEIVRDEENNEVFQFKKGDLILDEKGDPIVDTTSGVVRYIDILLLEYEFMLANTSGYVNYRSRVVSDLNNYIINDMESINNKLLENTEVLYKSYKTCVDVKSVINNNYENIPYNITPTVTLYIVNSSSLTSEQMTVYRNTIGGIINRYLDNSEIKLEDIKNEIKSTLGATIASVKIEGIDPTNAEYVVLRDENIKLTLNKKLALNANSELIVQYAINLVVQYI